MTPIMEKPPVFYHTMGKVKYYYGETWPLPQTKFTPYYFASEKGANSADGDGRLQMEIPTDGKAFDKYDYDPADPVPCRSGIVISPGDSLRQSQEVVECRNDVLVYSTDVLERTLLWLAPSR